MDSRRTFFHARGIPVKRSTTFAQRLKKNLATLQNWYFTQMVGRLYSVRAFAQIHLIQSILDIIHFCLQHFSLIFQHLPLHLRIKIVKWRCIPTKPNPAGKPHGTKSVSPPTATTHKPCALSAKSPAAAKPHSKPSPANRVGISGRAHPCAKTGCPACHRSYSSGSCSVSSWHAHSLLSCWSFPASRASIPPALSTATGHT